MTNGLIILADKDYAVAQEDVDCIAMALKKNTALCDRHSKSYWHHFNVARAQIETSFADFTLSKFL